MVRGGVKEAGAQYQISRHSREGGNPVEVDSCLEGYKQTDIGLISSDWSVYTIGYFNPFVTSGSRGWAEFYSEFGDLFVRITNMCRDSIYLDLSNARYVSLPVQSAEGKRTALENGDVLISITADIGISSYVDENVTKPAFINQHVALVRFQDKRINSKFVSYFLASENIQKLFRGNTDQGAKAGINLGAIRDIKFAVPLLKEQTAIANALSDVDALITSLEKLITKKRAIKIATVQQLLTGKKRLPPFDKSHTGYKQTELGEIPEDWEVKELGKLLDKIIGGGTPSRSNSAYWGENIPWVTVKDFATFNPTTSQEYITKLGLLSSSSNLIPAGVLITSTRMALGKAVIYDVPVSINQDLKALFLNKLVDNNFLYYWFEDNASKIDELGSGSTVKGLSLPDLKLIKFRLPSKDEQFAIASVISDMDKEIEALQQRLSKTQQLKQGMMQELLTGKTRLV